MTSRRDFIKQLGLAAGVGIPFLTSKVAMGQTSVAPLRVLIVPIQHGWGVDKEVSAFTGTTTNFTIPRPLDFLNSVKADCTFVDGLRSSYWGNAHDVSYSDILTCGVRYEEPSFSALGGPFPRPRSPSIDWLIANHHGKQVMRFSNGYASWGAAHHPLCFDDQLRNLPFNTTARSAYQSVIDPLKQAQNNNGNSNYSAGKDALFSYLGKDTNRLLNRVNGNERQKLQGYLSALNDLGNRIVGNVPSPVSNIPLPNLPGLTVPFSEQLDQYFEMIRIGFAVDTHRVAVLGLGEGVSNWRWNDSSGTERIGNTFGNDFHHEIAHYDSGPNYTVAANPRAAYEGWVRWYGAKLLTFITSLKNTTDVDGRSLLDNTMIILTGEVANGRHQRHDTIYPIIGGASRMTTGRWISTAKVDPRNRGGVFLGSRDVNGVQVTDGINYGPHQSRHHMADLWVSIARHAGVPINTFGIDVYNYQPIQL